MSFMSTMTFGQAKTRIATSLGGQGDVNVLTLSGYALQHAIRYISGQKDWNWTLTPATPIPLVVGTQDYALPTDFKKIYDAKIPGYRELIYCDIREYNRADWAGSMDSPCYYTVVNYGTPRLTYLRFLPAPVSDPGDVQVAYFRNISMPSLDATTLDIPAVYENMIIFLAKGYLLADRDAENARTAFWLGRGEDEMKRFKADDDYQPDRETRLIPAAEWMRPGWDRTHPYYYLDQP